MGLKNDRKSVKKTINKRIKIRQTKMGVRDKLRISGTPPRPISDDIINRNLIRSGENKRNNRNDIRNSGTHLPKSTSNLKELTLEYNKNVGNIIGVLIVNLNNVQLTKNCIESLNKQINKNFKIYLFDQNSDEEGTAEYLTECEKNNIQVFRNSENLPLNHIWNNFKNISDCEYLCFLNNDVVTSNNFIDDNIKILDNDSKIGAVIHVTNNPNYLKSRNSLNYRVFNDRPLYQGWDFTLRREIMPEIPSELLIFGGDDYIFAKINTLGHKVAVAYSSPIIHYKERTRVNIPNIHEIQRADATHFINRIRTERLIQIDSTMNHGVSFKYPAPNMELTQNKKCVFTAIIGDYDNITTPSYVNDDWDYICFTDNRDVKSDFWRVVYIDNPNTDFVGNIKLARYFKTNFHQYLLSYEELIWVDARITIFDDINKYHAYLNDNDIVFLKHPNASNIMEEFNRVLGEVERADIIEKIKERYAELGYDYKNGLISSGVLLFKNNEKVIKFFKEWWDEIENYSHRDQLSANFVLWKNPDLKYIMLGGILNYSYLKQLPRNTKPFRYE